MQFDFFSNLIQVVLITKLNYQQKNVQMLRAGEERARVSMYRRGYGDFKAGWLARDMTPLGLLLTLDKGMTL